MLARPLPDKEAPTPTHYTLEVRAYWNNDLLDTVESGRRRKVVMGGYNAGRRPDLQAELPLSLGSRFVVARLSGPSAVITVPQEAQVGLRTKAGEISRAVERVAASAPFPAYGVALGFGERLAFRLGALSVVTQFVRIHGKARRALDWLLFF